MLNGIQKITRRKMLWNRRAGRLKEGGLQRQREKIADEREGVKWLIFALSGARGICVTMLPHLSGLSDLTEARVIKGWERERYKKKKEGRKSASDSERHREKKTKQSGGIGMMTYWGGKSPSFTGLSWMSESRGGVRDWRFKKSGGRGWGNSEREMELRRDEGRRVMTRFWTACLSLRCALDFSLHSHPVCLLERKAELKRLSVGMQGR